MNQQHPDLTEFLDPSPPNHEVPLFAETYFRAEVTNISETFLSDNNQASTPTLTEAILEPDNFLKSFALPEDSSNDNHTIVGSTMLDAYISKMDIDNINRDCIMTAAPPHATSTNLIDRPGGISIGIGNQTVNVSSSTASTAIPFPSNYKTSPNCTPTNISPVVTPKTTSPDHQLSKVTDLKFINQEVGQRLMEQKWTQNTYGGMPFSRPGVGGTLHNFFNGLDAIPEDQVTDPPSVFQPLVPPPVPLSKVATTSYNISFPTTLQPRDRFDNWRGYTNTVSNSSARFSSGTGSSCSSVCSVPESPGSLASPFHEAKASNPYDVSEYQPLNVIEGGATSDSGNSRKSSSGYSSRSSSGGTSKTKTASKRSRTNSPMNREEDILSDGASSRIRRKSNASQANLAATGSSAANLTGTSSGNAGSSESKRRDSIKSGLEELQRTLPQFGTPEEEKISHSTILYEAAKYLKSLKQSQDGSGVNLETVSHEIKDMEIEIERLQSQLPDDGAKHSMNDYNSLVAIKRSLPDQFADHVFDKTQKDWKYWVFTSIMGHFVHSFEQEVSAQTSEDLQNTSLEWITNSMSLQQLRKDVARKLAKLNAKTSNSESTSTQDALKELAHTKVRPGGSRSSFPKININRP